MNFMKVILKDIKICSQRRFYSFCVTAFVLNKTKKGKV